MTINQNQNSNLLRTIEINPSLQSLNNFIMNEENFANDDIIEDFDDDEEDEEEIEMIEISTTLDDNQEYFYDADNDNIVIRQHVFTPLSWDDF